MLEIRGSNGVVSFPSIKGATGKSAYDFAKEAGYTGTIEDYAKLMAYDAKGAIEEITKDENIKSIVNVTELPTGENINKNAFYKMSTACFIINKEIYENWICHCVDRLPEVGEPVSTDMVNITAYYNVQDNTVYGYADSMISAAGGIPVGWYSMDIFSQAFDVPYSGVITDIDDDPEDDSFHILVQYDFYIYDNGFIKLGFGYEKQPEFDIKWDGNIGDRFTLDLTPFGFSGLACIKLSDQVLTAEQLIGATISTSDDYNCVLTDSDFDDTTYPGLLCIGGSMAISVYSAESVNSMFGLPDGYITNGLYFSYAYDAEDASIQLYINRLVAPSKVVKIDKKYLPDLGIDDLNLSDYAKKTDLNNYAKSSELSNYAKTSTLSNYAKKTDLNSYAKTSTLSDYAKTSTLSDYAKTSTLSDYAKKTDLDNLELPESSETKDYFLIKDASGIQYALKFEDGIMKPYLKCTGIRIDKYPDKTIYTDTDEFDPTGMVVTAIYPDGTTKEVNNYKYPKYLIIGGTTTILISYEEYGSVFTAPINVIARTLESALVDFEYTTNSDGTYTLTDWKGTLNGVASTRCILPNSNLLIL